MHRNFQGSLPARLKACLIPFTAAALLALAPSVYAQAESAAPEEAKSLKLFDSSDTLALEIKGPWRHLVKNKKNEDPYPASMTWTDETGKTTTVPVTVERRGITRQVVCEFPPIRLRMEKEAVKGTTFRGQDKLKLVTHCDKGERWEQYYVKEMLAYQIYNQITPISHRVRPLTITYAESEGGGDQPQRFGFLIEDDGDVAKRNELKKQDVYDIEPELMEPQSASRFAFFQYMIGNVDWSSLTGPGSNLCCHNAVLLGTEPTGNLIPLPYDFDSSGLVDAHYAAPNEGMPINSVTERLWRGFCVHNPALQGVRQEYLAAEPKIMALIQNEERLNSRSEKVATKYLGEFFAMLKDDTKFEKEFIGKCRK